MPASAQTPSAPTTVSATRGNQTVHVAWGGPATSSSAVGYYTISSEVWGPSVGRWHSLSYRTVPSTQLATTYRGLDNGRAYRFRVTAHNGAGNSSWTQYVKGIPATAPLAPQTDRRLTAGSTYIRFGWYGSVPQGAPVTAYDLAIRYWNGSAWTAWSYTRVPSAELTYRWDGLRRNTTYQVTARARSGAGSSPWGAYRKLVTSP